MQYGAPIKVSHSTSRGYFLSVPAGLNPLPNVFNQAVLNKRTISCSTEEFDSLSNRYIRERDSFLLLYMYI